MPYSLEAVNFENMIIRSTIEKSYEELTDRIYVHKRYHEPEFTDHLGEPLGIEILDKFMNFNSSSFEKIVYKDIEIVFMKIYGQYEVFRVEVTGNSYSTLDGLTIGSQSFEVAEKLGMPYRQEVLNPGEVKHSYIIPDQLAQSRSFAIELVFIYDQEGPRMTVKHLYVSRIPTGV